MKILITGFAPFGGEKINPSWEAVKGITNIPDGVELVRRELPVEWIATPNALRAAVDEVKPDAVLLVGQAGGREGITVELVALNIAAPLPDNKGFAPTEGLIIDECPLAVLSTLPVHGMVSAINNAGVPAKVSYHAGAYLCNCSLFYALAMGNDRGFDAGFIHVPYMVGQSATKPVMELADMIKALEAALQYIADDHAGKERIVPEFDDPAVGLPEIYM